MSETFRPFNQDRDPEYNREAGIAVIEGSNAQREMAKWEQFRSRWTGSGEPGNPYVYRPFPKMLYQAHRHKGALAVMAAPPDPSWFKDPQEYARAEAEGEAFNRKCQMTVNDENQYQRAMESGWRETPQEAMDFVKARESRIGDETAERLYRDRNMGEAARAEAQLVTDEAGGEHQPVITPQLVAEAKDGRRKRREA